MCLNAERLVMMITTEVMFVWVSFLNFYGSVVLKILL